MARKEHYLNQKANESVSKFKLLSAYGGPGSIVHTQYGSIIISCIEEWGFLKKVMEIDKEARDDVDNNTEEEVFGYVFKHTRLERNGSFGISNDTRLLESLCDRKTLPNLKYLSLIPDIELRDFNNKVKEGVELTIPSTFMPKLFVDNQNIYKSYNEWFKDWTTNKVVDDEKGNNFFPPKFIFNEGKGWFSNLKQDNIILLCEHGHISDFPWSQFLRWRNEYPNQINEDNAIPLFKSQLCCGTHENPTAKIKIFSNNANASGFDSKFIKCMNPGCKSKPVSLKGLMGVKIVCPGHLPWEANTGNAKYYSGDRNVRNQKPPFEMCKAVIVKDGEKKSKPMKVALTTSNNLYYSRMHSSIYMPNELYKNELEIELEKNQILEKRYKDRWDLAIKDEDEEEVDYNEKKWRAQVAKLKELGEMSNTQEELFDSEKEVLFKFQEFKAFSLKSELEINEDEKHLKGKDVTENLAPDLSNYFSRILRIDNMKITSAQLDFSRVVPADADAENIISKNIFRSKPESVIVYPVVENFGEGVFFAFNDDSIKDFAKSEHGISLIKEFKSKLSKLRLESNSFNKGAIDYGNLMNWQLYLVHSFTHLIMRELEFRCGYPTASLSERIYVSNDDKYKMYGCMVYTAEGAEGSMGGLIAQTRQPNLNNLIRSALMRATICHSDPLCWESEGQGLFDLNFASCFSCSLVSETSCEHRNLYLDRRILVDEKHGFFKNVINNLG